MQYAPVLPNYSAPASGPPSAEKPSTAGSSSADKSIDVKRGVHRTSTACAPCRKRKGRCDGALPVCGPCAKSRKLSNADCQYTESRDRAANSRAYIASSVGFRIDSQV